MQHRNMFVWATVILVVLALISAPAVALADTTGTFTLGTDYSYTTLNDQWVGSPISGSTLTINGVVWYLPPVLCITPNAESLMGTSWLVDVVSSPLSVFQKKEAIFASLPESGQYDGNVRDDGMWDLAIPGMGAILTGLPANADVGLLTWLSIIDIDNYNYTAELFVPIDSDNQTFITIDGATLISNTPEPRSLVLLGTGFLFLSGFLWWRRCVFA